MDVVAFDLETELIRPANLAPRPVCVTWQRPGLEPRIKLIHDAEPTIREWLMNDQTLLVGHNVAFDLAVIAEHCPRLRPLIFRAYDADRITDTMIRAQLLDIAGGVYRGRHVGKGIFVKYEYTLEAVARRAANIELQKDAWRMSYAEFMNVPLEQWPARAREVQAKAKLRLESLQAAVAAKTLDGKDNALQKEMQGLVDMIASAPEQCLMYPLDDARATLAAYLSQERHADPWLYDQHWQARASFALYLSAAWGLRTDEQGVEILRREVTAELEEIEEELMQLGIVRNDKKRSRDTKLAKARMIEVCAREGLVLRRTDAHTDGSKEPGQRGCQKLDGTPLPDEDDACELHVCLDEDACLATEDPVLVMYAELSTLKKVLSNDVEALAKGILYPVHTRYGLAETGRTTSSKPNIQNWVRARPCKACGATGKAAVAA